MTEHVTLCDTGRHAGTKELKVSQQNLLRKPLKNMKKYIRISKIILQCQTRLCGGQAGTALASAQNCLSTMEGDK